MSVETINAIVFYFPSNPEEDIQSTGKMNECLSLKVVTFRSILSALFCEQTLNTMFEIGTSLILSVVQTSQQPLKLLWSTLP